MGAILIERRSGNRRGFFSVQSMKLGWKNCDLESEDSIERVSKREKCANQKEKGYVWRTWRIISAQAVEMLKLNTGMPLTNHLHVRRYRHTNFYLDLHITRHTVCVRLTFLRTIFLPFTNVTFFFLILHIQKKSNKFNGNSILKSMKLI